MQRKRTTFAAVIFLGVFLFGGGCKKNSAPAPEKKAPDQPSHKEGRNHPRPRRLSRNRPGLHKPGSHKSRAALWFTEERVTLDIGKKSVRVDGLYTFKNPTHRDWRGRIGYPIYVSPSQPAPKHVEWHRINPQKLKVRCHGNARCAAVLSLNIGAGKTEKLHLSYRQPLKKRRAVYLVTTAQRWGRPLEKAEFIVHVPGDRKNVKLSYPPDGKTTTRGKGERAKRTYRIIRRNFVPDRELEVRW